MRMSRKSALGRWRVDIFSSMLRPRMEDLLNRIATLAIAACFAPLMSASAQDASPGGDLAAGKYTGRFSVGLGLDAGGPLQFRDSPDTIIDSPTVFQSGGRLAFRWGDPRVDAHRVGLSVGYHRLARRGDGSTLTAITPALMYAAGGLTEVQALIGYQVALASTDSFTVDAKVPYSGLHAGLELRHSFLPDTGKLGIVAGVFTEGTLGSPTTYSTLFAGARVEITLRKSN